MRDEPIDATLSYDEWALVSAVREMPPSALKTRVAALLAELVAFIEDPRCAEVQGDGMPCDNVHTACAQCAHVVRMIDSMGRVSALAGKA